VRPLVVIDADVLGRQRTGDETYVLNLLRHLPSAAEGRLRLAAVTRRPDLVPAGVEPVLVATRPQELRMAWSVPRVLRRLRPALAHFQHALPLRCPCPAVVTVHDVSFERDPSVMPLHERAVFKTMVPRSARKAVHVFAVSDRTKADIVALYAIPQAKITVTPHGVEPLFSPGVDSLGDYVLLVGSVEARKNPLAAADAASAVGLPFVVAGPVRDAGLARELERSGASLRGYVSQDELVELYRGAACLVMPSRYEGFGLPVLEAMACGIPVVAASDPALREVAGDAAIFVAVHELAEGIRQALTERERLVAAGLERARLFTWEETARRTVDVYLDLLRLS
jgi:glycosyltransferase involved in cell wall biosynthesis